MKKILLLWLILSSIPSIGFAHDIGVDHSHYLTLVSTMGVAAMMLILFLYVKNLSAKIKSLTWIMLVALLLLAPSQAMAHHPMGGAMPDNFIDGFLSGIGHPIIQLDHFMFLIIVALFASILRSFIILPATFVTLAMLGTSTHMLGIYVDPLEAIIISSLVAGGVGLIITNLTNLNNRIYKILVFTGAPLFGVFHGYAYAEAIIGAENTPLIAYLIALAIVQFVIISSTAWILNILEKSSLLSIKKLSYFSGVLAIGVALPYIHSVVLSNIFPNL